MKTLVIGYGNLDRQDDGVAWHILRNCASRMGLSLPETPYEQSSVESEDLRFDFYLQLTPELAEHIARYDRVCFVDAHTGAVAGDLHIEELRPGFQTSPLTHHLTPQSLLELVSTIYHRNPRARLVSVRGYNFEFDQTLSPRTDLLAKQAAEELTAWIKTER